MLSLGNAPAGRQDGFVPALWCGCITEESGVDLLQRSKFAFSDLVFVDVGLLAIGCHDLRTTLP